MDFILDYGDRGRFELSDLRDELAKCGCLLNIHWSYDVDDGDDLSILTSLLHQYPVKSNIFFLSHFLASSVSFKIKYFLSLIAGGEPESLHR